MSKVIEKLQYAKKAVFWLIEHENGLVDMHDLSYWAKEVERLRAEIKKSI